MMSNYRRIDLARQFPEDHSPVDWNHPIKRPRGRYARLLAFIGYGQAPRSPQAEAMAAS